MAMGVARRLPATLPALSDYGNQRGLSGRLACARARRWLLCSRLLDAAGGAVRLHGLRSAAQRSRLRGAGGTPRASEPGVFGGVCRIYHPPAKR